MKLAFEKSDLLRGINIVSKAVSSKALLPIMRCIRIDASDEEIILFANDMELAIRTKVEGEIQEEGSIALDAKLFSEMVKKMEDGVISISTDSKLTTTIKCGKAKFTIPGLDASEFPPAPEVSDTERVEMSQFLLKEMIRQTIFSLNMSEANKLMTGELFDIREDSIRLVALDGHRIAIRQADVNSGCTPRKEIIPGRTLNDISRVLSDNLDSRVSITFSSTHGMFEFDNTVLYTRLIEGNYFEIDRMLTSNPMIHLVVNKKELFDSLDRAGLLIKEGEKRPVILEITRDRMDISMNTSMGRMDDVLAIDKAGDDIRIGFSPWFITDAIKVIDDDMIHMYMNSDKSPCIIKNYEESYIYLILPVSIA